MLAIEVLDAEMVSWLNFVLILGVCALSVWAHTRIDQLILHIRVIQESYKKYLIAIEREQQLIRNQGEIQVKAVNELLDSLRSELKEHYKNN